MSNTQPAPAWIEPYLDRISSSVGFCRSERMVRFLRYVVGESLGARADTLKERPIAERVFDRTDDYDPKLDPIVRTEARRLRKKLESYYAGEGRQERLRIRIPKGGYRVCFEMAGDARPSGGLVARCAKRGPALAAGVAVLAFVWILHRTPAVPASAAGYEIVPVASEYGQELSPAISPDGRRIAYVWDGNGSNFDIYLKDVRGGSPPERVTTDPAPDLHPAWSPDGRSLAFLRVVGSQALLVERPLAGAERIVARLRQETQAWTDDESLDSCNRGPVFTPDGLSLIVNDDAGTASAFALYRIERATGRRTVLTAPPGMAHDFYPALSPDGSRIAFIRYSSHGVGEVFSMPASGGAPVPLTHLNRGIRGQLAGLW